MTDPAWAARFAQKLQEKKALPKAQVQPDAPVEPATPLHPRPASKDMRDQLADALLARAVLSQPPPRPQQPKEKSNFQQALDQLTEWRDSSEFLSMGRSNKKRGKP